MVQKIRPYKLFIHPIALSFILTVGGQLGEVGDFSDYYWLLVNFYL